MYDLNRSFAENNKIILQMLSLVSWQVSIQTEPCFVVYKVLFITTEFGKLFCNIWPSIPKIFEQKYLLTKNL